MGVDTKLYISRDWTVQDIKEVIEERFGVKTTLRFHDWAPDYMNIDFTLPGGQYGRSLHVFTNSHIGGFPAINLNFRSNPEGIQILQTLAKTFGGLFQEADCDNDFVEYQKPGEGNIDFVLKEAIKRNPELADNSEKMGQFIVEGKWRTK